MKIDKAKEEKEKNDMKTIKQTAIIKNKKYCTNGSDEMTTTYSFFWDGEPVDYNFAERADSLSKIGDKRRVAINSYGKIVKVYPYLSDKLIYGAIASISVLAVVTCFILTKMIIT